VRDHCHISGKFRGAAHNSCNINYKVPIVSLCFFIISRDTMDIC